MRTAPVASLLTQGWRARSQVRQSPARVPGRQLAAELAGLPVFQPTLASPETSSNSSSLSGFPAAVFG